MRHIPSLDGIRAISFFLVFLAHAGLESIVPGGLGVTIFFFLSGYLITTLLRSEFDRTGRIHFQHFWLRRSLRIFPAFYLVLLPPYVLHAAASGFGPDGAQALLAQGLHLTNYWIIYRGYDGFPPDSGTGVYWSLAVEEHFYLLFPWVFALMRTRGMTAGRQASLLAGLCLLVLAWRCALVWGMHVPTNRTYMGSDTRVDSILFGCLLAVWRNPALDDLALDEGRWKRIYVPAALALLAASLLVRGEGFRETLRYSLQGLALMPLFVAAVRFAHWPALRWLNWRPVAFLGVLSYSMYLLHYGVLFLAQELAPDAGAIARAIASLLVTIVGAWAIYQLVERPCARLRRRLAD